MIQLDSGVQRCRVATRSLRNAGVAVQDRAVGSVFTLK